MIEFMKCSGHSKPRILLIIGSWKTCLEAIEGQLDFLSSFQPQLRNSAVLKLNRILSSQQASIARKSIFIFGHGLVLGLQRLRGHLMDCRDTPSGVEKHDVEWNEAILHPEPS